MNKSMNTWIIDISYHSPAWKWKPTSIYIIFVILPAISFHTEYDIPHLPRAWQWSRHQQSQVQSSPQLHQHRRQRKPHVDENRKLQSPTSAYWFNLTRCHAHATDSNSMRSRMRSSNTRWSIHLSYLMSDVSVEGEQDSCGETFPPALSNPVQENIIVSQPSLT